MDQENNDESPSTNQIYDLHKARIMDIVKYLKNGKGVITIKENESGQSLRYGHTDQTSLSIKDFFKSALPNASNNAISQYFRSDYELIERATDYNRIKAAHKNRIENIEVSFIHRRAGSKGRKKQDFYFQDTSTQQHTAQQIYPNITDLIVNKVGELKSTEAKKGHEIIRSIYFAASAFCFRDETLEVKVLDYLLRINDPERLQKISDQLKLLIDNYEKKHAYNKENERYKTSGQLLPDQKNFYYLTSLEKEKKDFYQDNKVVDFSNFESSFLNNEYRFTGNRLKQLNDKREQLLNTSVDQWSDGIIIHVLFALHEYICVKNVLRDIVIEEADKVVYKISYSKNGKKISAVETEYSEQKVIETLTNYKINSSNLTDRVQVNGTILESPLMRLPEDAKNEHNLDTSIYADRLNEMVKQFIADKLLQKTGFEGEVGRL